VEASKVGCFSLNLLTSELQINKHLYDLIGLPRESKIEYEDWLHRVHPQDQDRVHESIKQGAVHGQYSCRHRVLQAEQSVKHVQGCGENHHNKDGTISLVSAFIARRKQTILTVEPRCSARPSPSCPDQVGTMTDITELVLLQEKEVINARLQKTLDDDLKHRSEMQRMLRTLSHEIRNPLQGILSNTQTLLSLTTQHSMHSGRKTVAEAGNTTMREHLEGALPSSLICVYLTGLVYSRVTFYGVAEPVSHVSAL